MICLIFFRSKTTNKRQQTILINLMEASPDIARGFHRGNKEEVARFWRNAEMELNSVGPPIKNITEWKKVWTDQKKYVRHKAAENFKHSRGTGGGPNVQKPFSPIEEAIYNLIGMKESVEGVPAKTFGLASSDVAQVNEVPEGVELCSEDLEVIWAEKYPATVEESPPVLTGFDYVLPAAPKRASNPTVKAVAKNATEVVEAERAIQRDMLEKVTNIVTLMTERNEADKKHFEAMKALKREEIDEMHRHNDLLEELLRLNI
ncbi:uncharacterized protein LOC118753100 [Rhagoletis pomonella]|uniref:uncharacterized protein LOC118753100 n=1 Tax=Rhagoletis pomonella TaxID=28610 RepID=UPI00177E6512|nr:uncharacterized protein LOC118753100 [Rhagoletis pomonella]